MKTKILYAEDEPILAQIVKEGLEKLNYQVIHATDGERGLDLSMHEEIDICLLDVMMPKLDGFSLGRKIRAKHPSIPIIFLTAKSATEDVVEGFSSGGNDYLRKPFSMQELQVRIENLLSIVNKAVNLDHSKSAIIAFGNYTYNSQSQVLTYGERENSLSYREHELLMQLLTANNTVVKRRDLLIDIWGDDSFFQSRNLDVYVRKIRKYFEEGAGVQLITLKGVGYKFIY